MFDGKSGSGDKNLKTQREIYTPGRLNREARSLLEGRFKTLWLEGEISNLSRPASGHLYFGLKDDRAQVRCAFFRSSAARMKFRPKDGDLVLAQARVSLYEARGDFQLIVQSMEPAGAGRLQAAFEALKKKLAAEGLFDDTRKQDLPAFPRRIAIVTSPSGAAVQDVVSVIQRRAPFVELLIVPAPVQGEDAPEALAHALIRADRLGYDAILLTRGGGSLEDLWAFNDESLARVIVACKTPVMAAVGHEVDFTIAEFVADQRAPTPSAAAEVLVPDGAELKSRLSHLQHRQKQAIQRQLQNFGQRVDGLDRRLRGRHPGNIIETQGQRADRAMKALVDQLKIQTLRRTNQMESLRARLRVQHPARRLESGMQQLNALWPRLPQAFQRSVSSAEQRLRAAAKALHLISPLATLDRGYSLSFDNAGKLVRSISQIQPGEEMVTRTRDGELISTVNSSRKLAE